MAEVKKAERRVAFNDALSSARARIREEATVLHERFGGHVM